MNTIEMGQLKFNIDQKGNDILFKVEGSINEDLQIEKLTGLKGNKFIFDMNGVKMINSCGIREWIRFIESYGAAVTLEYSNVPQIVVQQMNMISGFLSKNAKVTTFYAPYFIEDLDQEQQVLLKVEDIKDFKAPKMKAKVDGEEHELEFDAIEDQYFRFLKK